MAIKFKLIVVCNRACTKLNTVNSWIVSENEYCLLHLDNWVYKIVDKQLLD